MRRVRRSRAAPRRDAVDDRCNVAAGCREDHPMSDGLVESQALPEMKDDAARVKEPPIAGSAMTRPDTAALKGSICLADAAFARAAAMQCCDGPARSERFGS